MTTVKDVPQAPCCHQVMLLEGEVFWLSPLQRWFGNLRGLPADHHMNNTD